MTLRRTSMLLAVLGALPYALHAQAPRPGDDEGPGWAPPSIGVRVGYDNTQDGPMTGVSVGIPLLPSGSVELRPNADITFLPGFKEYQYNIELVYFTAVRTGGLFAGGGIGWRNSTFSGDVNAPHRTEQTFSIVFGGRLQAVGGLFRPTIEARWILQDEWTRDPQHAQIGVAMHLWTP